MATDKRQFTMRMQNENFDKMRVIAAVNKRSMAMQIEYLMEQCIADYESRYGNIPIQGSARQNIINQSNQHGNNVLNIGG